jgi:hypothetical protein
MAKSKAPQKWKEGNAVDEQMDAAEEKVGIAKESKKDRAIDKIMKSAGKAKPKGKKRK